MGKKLAVIAILAVICLLLWAMWIIYSRITANRIMREGRNKKNFAFNYLSMRFSRLNTMKNVRLLVEDPSVQGGRYVSDVGTVFVNRGGVFVIESVYGSGFVDVDEGRKWSRTNIDRQYTFDDPLALNLSRVIALKTFLKNMNVYNVPVHNVVLFTGNRVKFSKRINGLVTASELAAYLSDANMDRHLNNQDIRKIVKLIKSNQP